MAAAPELGRATQIEPVAPRSRSRLAADLFEEYSRRVYAYCLRQLRSPEEAEDAVQATYLSACRHLMRGFEPEAAQAWLLKVAENECLTRLRSQSRRARVESGHDVEMIEETVAAPNRAPDELFGIDDALAALPEQQRRAILLREWQGLSYREVAAELGISQAAVETLIFRARRSLAAALETMPQPELTRRRVFRGFGLGELLAGLKASLATNLSLNVATSVAVATSAATLAAGPSDRAALRPAADEKSAAELVAPAPPSAGAERASVTRRSEAGSPTQAKPGKRGNAFGHGKGHGNGHGKGHGQGHGKAKGHGKGTGHGGPPAHANAHGAGGHGGGHSGHSAPGGGKGHK